MRSRHSATYTHALSGTFARSLRKSLAAPLSVALALSIAGMQSAGAQSAHRWSVQASGLYVGVGGEAYDGLGNGPGGEVQVRYSFNAFSVGAGVQGSSHKFTDKDFAELDNVSLYGGFIEPRYVFVLGSDKMAPYLSARVAYLRQQLDVPGDGETFSLTADGTQFNGGGGILFRLTSRVNLDLGGTFGSIKFDDLKVSSSSGESAPVTGSSGSGTNFVIRIGASIGIGR